MKLLARAIICVSLVLTTQSAFAGEPDNFIAPKVIAKNRLSIVAHYFDSSFTILSSSGDTDDITVAKKGDRFYLYSQYNLVGSDKGYSSQDVLSTYQTIPVEKRTLGDHLELGVWIGTGTAFVLAILDAVGGATVQPGDLSLIGSAGVFMGSMGLGVSAIVERAGGQTKVFKTTQEFLSKLQKGELEVAHVEVMKYESSHYSNFIKKTAALLDKGVAPAGCNSGLSKIAKN